MIPATSGAATGRPRPIRMLWITAAWGGCFAAIRWGLADAPILWFAALRALVAGVALVALGMLQHRPHPRGGPAWLLVGVLGVVNVTIAFGAMFAGVAGVATGIAAVLANAQPLLILLPAWWLYRERLDAGTVGMLVVGFAGLLIVALPGGGGQGAWLSLAAAGAITGGTLLSRRLGGMDVVMASGWHFLIGGVLLAVVALLREGSPAITWTPGFVIVLAFLGLVGTAAAFVAWFQETVRCPLGTLSAWMFLVPVFGMAVGLVALGERPGPWTLLGLALVLGSLWLTLRPGRSGGDGLRHHHVGVQAMPSLADPLDAPSTP